MLPGELPVPSLANGTQFSNGQIVRLIMKKNDELTIELVCETRPDISRVLDVLTSEGMKVFSCAETREHEA